MYRIAIIDDGINFILIFSARYFIINSATPE